MDIQKQTATETERTALDREVNKICCGESGKGRSSAPCEPKVQGADPQQKNLQEGIQFWTSSFAEELTALDLPLDYPRGDHSMISRRQVSHEMEPKLGEAVSKICHHYDVTEHTVFLSAVMVLLAKYGRQEDVTVGTVLDGSLLPIRGKIGSDQTCGDVLEQLRDFSRKAFAYGHSFGDIAEDLSGKGSSVSKSLFDVIFLYHSGEGVEDCREYLSIDHDPSVLTFCINKGACSYNLTLEYAQNLFTEATAQRIMEHYEVLLSAMLCETKKRIGDYCLLTSQEAALIREMNHTAVEFGGEKTIVGEFRQQVRLHSNRIALRFGEETLTYQELERRANALGITLRNMGVGPNDLVALYAPRGIMAFVGIFGILYAGGAYMPMDPHLPEDRLNYMFSDSQCKAVVYYGEKPKASLPMVDLGDYATITADTPIIPMMNEPNDLAYCIYTSGTTGRPKGVLIEHKGVLNLNWYYRQEYAIVPEDRILQFANLVFDASVWEWVMALLNGSELVIARERTDPQGFAEEFRKQGITVASVLPNFYIQLPPISPRLMITGGAASDRSILEKVGDIPYFNVYGPTETTICATSWRRQGNPAVPPIGKPLPNMEAHVLNGLTPCAIGEIGELCIGGIGLARGYLNKPELTAEKFIPNPFGEGRIYRTGDLVRRLPDGNLVFIGRMDQQVKLRGFRVELGEIEAVMRKFPHVKEAAVLLRKDTTEESNLYAYYSSTRSISQEEYGAFLRRQLPDYMIPAFFTEVERIPVTTSGKVDYRALPIPETKKTIYEAPVTHTEKLICRLFAEILGLHTVGRKDDFFALGGHSLRAAKLANRIEDELSCRIPVSEIFVGKTPEALGIWIHEHGSEAGGSIPRAELRDCYPMSPAQKRMYLVQQMDPLGISYNIPVFWAFRDKPDPDRIQKTLETMICRHEILRTVFSMENGEGVQRVLPQIPTPFACTAWKGSWESYDQRNFVKPFSMEEGPLLRMELMETEDQWVLMLDIHHIVTDGLSMALFCKEFARLYAGEELPAPKVQYKDYSQWILSHDLMEAEKYWKEQLKEPPVTELPLDHSRPQKQTFEGATVYTALPEAFLQKIRDLCKTEGTTDYMVFAAGLMVLLGKYARQEDVIIGSAYSGRTHRDTEDMLGMFVSTLALRGAPVGEKTFRQFLGEVRKLSMEAYGYQNYPFEELVDALGIKRNSSGNPLFDVMLAMEEPDAAQLRLGEAEGQILPCLNQGAKFDLNFMVEPGENSCSIALEYATALYEQSTAERILAHYVEILRQLVEAPEEKLARIAPLTPGEKQQILVDFNQTDGTYPAEATLVSLFRKQAEKTPHRIAVSFGQHQLTYRELDRRSDLIARALRYRGIGTGDLVPLFIERCPEMVVGLYGILKSGAAYVPINTSYPGDRVAFILEDCQGKILLTGKTPLPTESDIPQFDLIDFDYDQTVEIQPEATIDPEDLAYIIYTSGTTGKPKGVMICHRNVVRLMRNSRFQFDFTQEDVWMMFHSYGFDFSVWEMYGATLFGGKLVVVDEETAKDSNALKDLMIRQGVTVLNQVPSSFYNLQRCCDGRENLKVRYLIFGGEALHPGKLEPWHRWFPQCRIINMYGITETTVHVTYREIGDKEIRAGISDIGSAIPTLKVYILQGDTLCGIGVPGELCVAGEGLAKGYLHRPDLTESKFVPNPFGEGKLYRSGDLARWRPDGNLEYLGRIDDQVKIRGFRIELGEIETGLRHCDGVKDCAVILRKDAMGEPAIYAYAVADGELDFGKIRDELRASMPEYMIPSYMMQIPTIPVTGNGKLDRKALPAFTGGKESAYIAPRNPTEESLCALFRNLLGTQRVSVEDSFFELGGHSLRAVELAARIREEFEIDFTLRDVFLYPTVAQIAGYLQGASKVIEDLPIAEEREYYPLSPSQKGIYFAASADETGIAYNMPYVFRLRGTVEIPALQRAFRDLIDRHEILRTGFFVIDGEPMQRVFHQEEGTLEVCQDLDRTVEELLQEFVRPFCLQQPPLIRGKLVCRKDEYILFIDLHHIVFDGLSGEILFRELSELYSGIKLPEPERQYKDYCAWMAGRDLSSQRDFWLEQFREAPDKLNLPTDFPRTQERSFRGGVVSAPIEPSLAEGLHGLATAEGVTDYTLYLSVAMILMGKYSRQESVVLGTASGGRPHHRLRNMVGMFVNTLALGIDLKKAESFRSFLGRVGELTAQALSNQDYSYSRLVEESGISGDPDRNPLFDVMFALEHEGEGLLTLPGVECEAVVAEQTTAKFDLTFQITQGEKNTRIALEYGTDLFREETAHRMIRHYIAILEQIMKAPEGTVASLIPLTQEERKEITGVFNATAYDLSTDGCLMELFGQRVKEQPDKTAVVYGEKSLNYRELNEKANAVAWTLRELGVSRGDRVAILPKRGIPTIVGLCGILKAGAAYVPIDPGYPEQRIRDILEDASPKAVLTYGCTVETALPVISLDTEADWDMRRSDIPLVNYPEDVANCIYTSGTTGKPKGVLVRHKGIVNLVSDCDYMPFSPETNTVQTGQLVFDASTFEIWGTLINGGCLHMIPQELLLDSEAFRKYLIQNQINMQFITTALFNQFVSYDPTMFDGIHAISFGGERVSEEHVRILLERNPKLRLTNCYGPTEATVIALRYTIPYGKEGMLPIGTPVHNTQVYIMQGDSLCGIGVPGELCIGGEGLAAGYLNRPELTEEKFVPNPFGTGKLYRTGDLARWLPNGTVDFMGRIDEQVKIRGFRIELAEIESVLCQCQGVKDCAVVVGKNPAGENALFAYVVGQADLAGVKKELGATLPAYMIPAYWTELDSIPLTRNGKLDRKALPQITEQSDREYTPPRDEMEAMLQEAFQKVLGVEHISIYDNFFELGGHSLKCARLVNLLRGQVGIKDVFEKKTIAALAEQIRGCAIAEEQGIAKQPDAPWYKMSEAQKRLYIFEELDESKSSYHVTSCYSLEGSFDAQKAEETFRKLIQRHESLRSSFAFVGEDFRQIVHEKAEYAMERICLGDDSIEDGVKAFLKPYDLWKPALFRTALAENNRGEQWLILDFHHIIIDGFSVDILLREFEILYNGGELPPQNLQYRDYSAWLEEKDLRKAEAYWLNQFAQPLPDADLPLDGKRREDLSHKGELVECALPALKKEEVEAFCKKQGVTPYAFFTAAVSAFLGRVYDTEDVTMGMPVSCRTHGDTETVVGMLVNTIALRSKPTGDKTFRAYLAEVKENLLSAMEHQEYPFNRLVERAKAHRPNGRAPLFDVFFNYFHGDTMEVPKGEGFTAKEYPVNIGAGKFDLVFDLVLQGEEYSLICNYRPALLKRETVETLQGILGNLILSYLQQGDKPLREADSLTEEQKTLLLEKFHTVKDFDRNQTFPHMLRQRARELPNHTALVFGEEKRTYADLNEQTDAIASYLLQQKAEREEIIAVIARPGFATFLGAIGAMKAGCAYMPIDPAYPTERIRHMLRQSKCRFLLKDEGSYALPEGTQTIEISEIVTTPIGTLPEPQGDDLAYVIFTSGSTGLPKGVMIEHHSLTNLILWHNRYYDSKETDRSTKYAGFGFDASVHEMYPPLAAGGTIYIIPEEMRMDLPGMAKYVEGEQINVGFFPTPVCEQFAKETVSCLTKVITGGDKLKTYTDQYPIYNNYGPTEGTVLSTAFKVDRAYDNIPIGKPIDNVRVYVVNSQGNLQPIGIPGEIWLSGEGISRGYIHDEERTKQRFIPDPFCPGHRIYKTGDIGKWLPDGNLLYLGRNDFQVKIRGNRVELGEIESMVSALLPVTSCAAVVDRSNQRERIALFYSGREEISYSHMTDVLGTALPKYMIPDLWIYLEHMPLTPNGKIHKEALVIPESPGSGTQIRLPKNPTEKTVHDIWSETLGIDRIDVEENFFEAGGTSLTLAMMYAKLNGSFQGVLQIGDVFAYPTIRKLSDFILSKTQKTERIMLEGVCLNNECYGRGNAGDWRLSCRIKGTTDVQELLLCALTYTLSRLCKNGPINFYNYVENCCFSTVVCDTIKEQSLKWIKQNICDNRGIWHIDRAIRKPGGRRTIVALQVGEKSLSRREEDRMLSLFDLWISAKIAPAGIELCVRNVSKNLTDSVCKTILKVLVAFLEK